MENKEYSNLDNFVNIEGLQLQENHFEWIGLLTKDNVDEIEKFREFLGKYGIGVAIAKYRASLREQGRGNIDITRMKRCFENDDLNNLGELLQEMFLEYMNIHLVERVVKILHNKNITIETLCKLHINHPNYRIQKLLKLA